jgi:hypothetical protein
MLCFVLIRPAHRCLVDGFEKFIKSSLHGPKQFNLGHEMCKKQEPLAQRSLVVEGCVAMENLTARNPSMRHESLNLTQNLSKSMPFSEAARKATPQPAQTALLPFILLSSVWLPSPA